ncbi:MAG TPA: 2OG-Fe(II) oxygenase family protein [Acidimicrobiales bacterium]|nr:2OG-Fe(II) oxygenase family protein [Acidimicrobiales bacterium]
MSNESLKIHTVNYSNVKSRKAKVRKVEIDLMHKACVQSGFFLLVNHGLEKQIGELFDYARRFFSLPQEEKERMPRHDRYGYVPNVETAINAERQTGKAEFFDLGLGDEIEVAELGDWKESIRCYQMDGIAVASELLKALGARLGVSNFFFAEKLRNPQCRLRFLHYTKNGPRKEHPLSPHTDYGLITLLATDGVPGLEILGKDNSWFPVVAPESSLVVNLGDMLARWTNDRYCSTPHRARTPDVKSRYSIPFFINPDPESVIEPIESCVTRENPTRYKPITAGVYLAARIDGDDEPYIE